MLHWVINVQLYCSSNVDVATHAVCQDVSSAVNTTAVQKDEQRADLSSLTDMTSTNPDITPRACIYEMSRNSSATESLQSIRNSQIPLR